MALPQDVRAPQDQAQDSAGAAPKGDEAVGANPWRRSRPPNTGTAAAGSGRVRKHLWLKEQTMQRCPRSSSLLARMRCLRARPRMRISSGSSHVNLAHDCRRAMPARRLPHQQLERVAPQAWSLRQRSGAAAAADGEDAASAMGAPRAWRRGAPKAPEVRDPNCDGPETRNTLLDHAAAAAT